MPQTILIADNNAFYRQVLGDFFRGEGYDVALADDGVSALEKVTAGGIDFILLDLIMPRIDGARLCSFLKSHPDYSSIPIVILSGILADEIEGFETINADAYVAKMPMEDLQAALRKVFEGLNSGSGPVLEGFGKMYRREVVLELLAERQARDVILNTLTEGIAELSGDRRVLRANRVFEEICGREGPALLSASVEDVFSESRQAVEVLFSGVSKSGAAPSVAVITLGDRSLRLRLHALGHMAAADAAIAPTIRRAAAENPKVRLLDPAMLPGYVLMLEDVTMEMRMRAERDRFREQMARSERMSALGIFVAGAAHELNNPLTAVLGYSQLLASRDLPDDAKRSLKKIEAGAARCRAIVENLLVFSRRGHSERSRHGVNEIAEAAIGEIQPKAEAAGVDIRASFEAGAPDVEVNVPEVLQAMSAVLDNAVLAAASRRSGGVVRVTTSVENGCAAIEVADNGPGIPSGDLARVFDPFFTTRQVGAGKGLGLSVTYGIVRAHGGSVGARNLPEGGACFTLRIPCAGSACEEASTAPISLAAGSKARILVVDDEPVVLDLLKDLFSARHMVETAANGREGLRKAEAESFDAIVLDIKMPDMTGRQMYEALLTLRPGMADRVVFTTGDIVHEETRQFLERVGAPFIGKPFSLDAVTDIVERIIGAVRAA